MPMSAPGASPTSLSEIALFEDYVAARDILDEIDRFDFPGKVAVLVLSDDADAAG